LGLPGGRSCGRLNNGFPRYTHPIAEPLNASLYGNDFEDAIKDLEIWKLCWITQVGPKCNHKQPCKRESREISYRRESNVITEAKIGVMWPQAKECKQPPKAERSKKRSSARASARSTTLQTPCSPVKLTSDFLPPSL